MELGITCHKLCAFQHIPSLRKNQSAFQHIATIIKQRSPRIIYWLPVAQWTANVSIETCIFPILMIFSLEGFCAVIVHQISIANAANARPQVSIQPQLPLALRPTPFFLASAIDDDDDVVKPWSLPSERFAPCTECTTASSHKLDTHNNM